MKSAFKLSFQQKSFPREPSLTATPALNASTVTCQLGDRTVVSGQPNATRCCHTETFEPSSDRLWT